MQRSHKAARLKAIGVNGGKKLAASSNPSPTCLDRSVTSGGGGLLGAAHSKAAGLEIDNYMLAKLEWVSVIDAEKEPRALPGD